jgi:acrylyl-CoA reductase (NADPH)
LREIGETELPAGNVVVRVHYSALDHKDALVITGKSPVVRHFPWCPALIWLVP